ncbi:hypothetical protein [Psychrobacillus sp. OK032]
MILRFVDKYMSIVTDIDVKLAKRKMSVTELSERFELRWLMSSGLFVT